ncbi:MAG TPA: amino acid adenylation domain-containing protein [Acidobacteriaceae bacterium]|nr:amino acid adenylation domain-containing protein [Acidobacteriaceae bacterium]
MNYNLALPFCEHAARDAEATALVVDERRWSYGELAGMARRIAGWLQRQPTKCVGILASRSVEAYAGVLGTLWAGAAYVPVHPSTPEERLIRILEAAQVDAIIADAGGLKMLTERVLRHAPRLILCGRRTSERVVGGPDPESFDQLTEEGPAEPAIVPDDGLAYILFTSGTTGTPKGVTIEAGCVAQLRKVVQERCGFQRTDRVSQMAELTFDNSVLDLFVTWAAGGSVYVVPSAQLMAPAKFIRNHELTIWFSVPSTAVLMEQMKMLKAGVFPSLRISMFAGEALPITTARAWQMASPNSIVENFYGPTEVTVDCIGQRLEEPPNVTRNRGTLAIGKPFPGIEAGIVDPDLKFLPPEEEGELVVSGRQVARGYLGDTVLTAARFPTIEGRRWYRTGDLAYQDGSGAFHHLGRVDNQVKVLGNRVELEEVEAHLREVLATDLVAAVAWPVSDGRATGIVAFHCAPGVGRDAVREGMKKRVPSYMVPGRVEELESLPMSTSGKVDRKALVRRLEEGAPRDGVRTGPDGTPQR